MPNFQDNTNAAATGKQPSTTIDSKSKEAEDPPVATDIAIAAAAAAAAAEAAD
jgi:hypothetical protein